MAVFLGKQYAMLFKPFPNRGLTGDKRQELLITGFSQALAWALLHKWGEGFPV